MTLSTTPTLEGNPIRQYLGVVTAESIVGANFVKDIMANVRDFFGGRSGAYEGVLIEARDTVLKELEERAARMGANAIVGISFDYETVGASGSMLMVVASGTAVVV
ncbi:MAG: heavy metal-binding domain-containing protein [Alloprevotella sp.]